MGLWQILVRQGTIPDREAEPVFAAIVAPFAQVRGDRELFDAGRGGVKALLAAAPGAGDAAAHPQERMVELLAGAAESNDAEVRARVEQDLGRILDAQRIVSLDTLFQLADHIEAIGKGAKLNTALINKLAANICGDPASAQFPLLQ